MPLPSALAAALLLGAASLSRAQTAAPVDLAVSWDPSAMDSFCRGALAATTLEYAGGIDITYFLGIVGAEQGTIGNNVSIAAGRWTYPGFTFPPGYVSVAIGACCISKDGRGGGAKFRCIRAADDHLTPPGPVCFRSSTPGPDPQAADPNASYDTCLQDTVLTLIKPISNGRYLYSYQAFCRTYLCSGCLAEGTVTKFNPQVPACEAIYPLCPADTPLPTGYVLPTGRYVYTLPGGGQCAGCPGEAAGQTKWDAASSTCVSAGRAPPPAVSSAGAAASSGSAAAAATASAPAVSASASGSATAGSPGAATATATKTSTASSSAPESAATTGVKSGARHLGMDAGSAVLTLVSICFAMLAL